LYNKYRNKGFEIYQISLDQSKTAWERAIKEDGLTWINVSDLKYWDSEILNLYSVETIPANFLLDRAGNIMTKNLVGDVLEKKLNELFPATE
jgi:peroxiredoxin